MISIKKIVLALSFLIFTENAVAQGGTAGAQELLLPVGGRSLALNNAFVAGTSGIEAIYYNPAGLIYNTGSIDAMFSYMSYIADINLSFAAIGANMGEFGAVALSMKSLDVGDIPVTTTQEPYGTGEFFSPTLLVAGLSYSRNISDNISIGFNTNIIFEKIIETSATGVSFDFGFQYADVGVRGLRVGAVIKNVGPEMNFDGINLLRTVADTATGETRILKIDPAGFELPLTLETGLTYITDFESDYNFLVTTSVLSSNFLEDQLRFAAEFNYDNLLFFRGGYHLNIQGADDDRNIYGPTFGLGLKLKTFFNISIDYAYRVARFFDSNQMVSVVISF